MKRSLLIVLLALMAVAQNGNAQNNTYNMVIEMANGTKITIGPNDVRNISFNNGELVMTGEDINSLVEQQKKMQVIIDSLYAFTMDNESAISELETNMKFLEAYWEKHFNTLHDKIYYNDSLLFTYHENTHEVIDSLYDICSAKIDYLRNYCDSIAFQLDRKLNNSTSSSTPNSSNYVKRNKLATHAKAPKIVPLQNRTTEPKTWGNQLRIEDRKKKEEKP